ncbi:unnamed protein product [Caenorhabditis nigoni]
MKLLTAVLVLLVSTNYVIGQDESSSTVTTVAAADTTTAASSTNAAAGSSAPPQSSSTGVPGSTAPAGTGSTALPGTGSTAPAGTGSTVTDSGNTGTTTGVPTTTPKPLELSTFPVSNDVTVLDAKLILQQAVQLDQQINALNDYLVKAQADTDPAKSPLFDQLNAFSANITAQNSTLQGYISQLQSLSASQSALDQRVSSATSTFVCFSQSSCVTDVPTTPEPTSPGSTPPVVSCNNETVTTDSDFSKTKSYSFANEQNVALCWIKVLASNQANNVSVTINATFTGPDAYVKLVETRTQQSAIINGSMTNYVFQGFQEVDVYYYSGPRSTVQFNFDYQEVNNCLLNCNAPNGECKVSPSGVQYCECKKCEFSGDSCQTALGDPCLAKQKRVCGQNASPQFGLCYKNVCSDSCYSCECSPDSPVDGTDQKCTQPTNSPWTIPVAPTPPTVCPTTAAPSTTTALLTSTAAPTIVSSSAVPGSSAAPVSTITSDSSATTVSSGHSSPSSSASPAVPSSVAASTSTEVPSTTTSQSGPIGGG